MSILLPRKNQGSGQNVRTAICAFAAASAFALLASAPHTGRVALGWGLQPHAGDAWQRRTQLIPDYTYKRGGQVGDDSSTTQRTPAGNYYGDYTGGVHTGSYGARAQPRYHLTQLIPDYTYKRGGQVGDDSSTTQRTPAGDYYGDYTGGVHTGSYGARAQRQDMLMQQWALWKGGTQQGGDGLRERDVAYNSVHHVKRSRLQNLRVQPQTRYKLRGVRTWMCCLHLGIF